MPKKKPIKTTTVKASLKNHTNKYECFFKDTCCCIAIYKPTKNNDDFIFVAFSKSAEKIDQVKEKDLIGKPVSQVFPGVKKMGLFKVFQQVNKTGLPANHPMALYKDNRITAWRENFVYKLASGEIVAVYHDLTDQQKTKKELNKRIKEIEALNEKLRLAMNRLQESEQRLLNANTELKRLDKLKDDFISTVSHELRTPLSVIVEVASSLHDRILGELNTKQSRVVDILNHNSKRLAKLIDDLLDISRLEQNNIKPLFKNISLREIIDEVYHDFLPKTKAHSIKIDVQVKSKLTNIYADKEMITQVIYNLMSNAFRFTKNKIIIKATQTKQKVTISITDNGKGISPEDYEKVFNKFEQVGRHLGGEGYKGTGLGLAISKKIIELHKGIITCSCTLNKGCTFSFTLPLKIQ